MAPKHYNGVETPSVFHKHKMSLFDDSETHFCISQPDITFSPSHICTLTFQS